jgi:purine nucleosidase
LNEIQQIINLGTEKARLAMECNKTALDASMTIQGASGLTLADPVAMAIALDPDIITRQIRYFVDVEITSELTRGTTVVDELDVLHKTPNMAVVWSINVQRWKEILYSCLR